MYRLLTATLICALATAPTAWARQAGAQGPYTLLLEAEANIMFLANGTVRRDGELGYVTSFIGFDMASMLRAGDISHMAMANEFNCTDQTSRAVAGKGYHADGRVVGEIPGNTEWRPISPRSPNAEMFAIVCRGEKPRGEVLGDSPESIALTYRASKIGG